MRKMPATNCVARIQWNRTRAQNRTASGHARSVAARKFTPTSRQNRFPYQNPYVIDNDIGARFNGPQRDGVLLVTVGHNLFLWPNARAFH